MYRSIYSKECYLPSHTTFPQLTEVTTANYLILVCTDIILYITNFKIYTEYPCVYICMCAHVCICVLCSYADISVR